MQKKTWRVCVHGIIVSLKGFRKVFWEVLGLIRLDQVMVYIEGSNELSGSIKIGSSLQPELL